MAGEDVAKELRIDEPTKMTQLRIFYMEGLTTPFCESTSYQMSKALRRVSYSHDYSAMKSQFQLRMTKDLGRVRLSHDCSAQKIRDE